MSNIKMYKKTLIYIKLFYIVQICITENFFSQQFCFSYREPFTIKLRRRLLNILCCYKNIAPYLMFVYKEFSNFPLYYILLVVSAHEMLEGEYKKHKFDTFFKILLLQLLAF